ncbi:unnamed protein product [Choristocarpus tenellus]
MSDRTWLVSLVLFMAHTEEYQERCQAVLEAFQPNRFRSEWDLFWELVDEMTVSLETSIMVRHHTKPTKREVCAESLESGVLMYLVWFL